MTTYHSRLRARRTRHDRGQGMVLLSLFVITLLGLVALGVDGGSLYMYRRQAQNAADAAALAGAFTLAKADRTGTDIADAICKFASKNYIGAASTGCLPDASGKLSACYTAYSKPGDSKACIGTSPPDAPPANATGVQVTTTARASTLFMPILGFNNIQVRGLAAAHGTPPAPGGPGYGMFAIESGQPKGTGVIDWSGGNWTVTGTIHSNSDIVMSGTNNTINGTVEDVSGASPTGLTGKATLTPSTNNPVQSTVLPDPVNQTFAHYCPSTTSNGAYHYINGNTNLSSFVTNGAMETGIYCVNGNINFSTGVTTLSTVTFVASGTMNLSAPGIQFQPYSGDKMLLFSDVTLNNTGLNISASGTSSWKGIAYAPHSTLQYSGGQRIVSNGSLVGWKIHISTGPGSLTYDSSLFAPSVAQIFLYQ